MRREDRGRRRRPGSGRCGPRSRSTSSGSASSCRSSASTPSATARPASRSGCCSPSTRWPSWSARPLLGRLSDRIGRKPVIVIALLGTALGSFITGAAGALWVLFAGRIIDGASGGSLSVAQAAVTDIAPPEQRPRLLGMLGAAFGIGFVLGPAIGGLAALGGPHVPFYVAGVLALINAVAAMIRLPETRTAVERTRRSSVRLPRSPVLRRLALIGFLTTFSFAAFEATFSLLGKRRFEPHRVERVGRLLDDRHRARGHAGAACTTGWYSRHDIARVLPRRRAVDRRRARADRRRRRAGRCSSSRSSCWGSVRAWPTRRSPPWSPQHAPADRRGRGARVPAVGVLGRPGRRPAGGRSAVRPRRLWSPYVLAAVLCAVGGVLLVAWRITGGEPVAGRHAPQPQSV